MREKEENMSEKPQNPFIITRPTPLISRSEGPTRDDSPEHGSSDPKRSQGTTARSDYAERYAAKTPNDDDLSLYIWKQLTDCRLVVYREPPRPRYPFWIIYNPDESIRIRVYEDCSMRISVTPEHRAQVCRAIADVEGRGEGG